MARGRPALVREARWYAALRRRALAKTLYLVRHGETEWTAARRLQGQTDVPLSCTGLHQAQEVAQHLADVDFDCAYASDLSRALDTAKAILAQQPRAVPLVVDAGLREISDGEYEGRTAADVGPDPRIVQAHDGPSAILDAALPGGESIRQVFSRQQRVAAQLMADKELRRILVVGHDWALRLLAVALVGECPGWFAQLGPLKPASVSTIEVAEGSGAITLWNETGHLGG